MVAALVLGSLAACAKSSGGGSGATTPPSPIPITQASAAADGTEVTVTAGLVAPSGAAAKLCDAMTMSIPPQCVGDGLEVVGLDLSTVPGASTDANVTWAPHVTVTGTMQGGKLTDATVVPTSTSS